MNSKFQEQFINYLTLRTLLKAAAIAAAAYQTNEDNDTDDCIITAVQPGRPQPPHNVTVAEQRPTAVSHHTTDSTVPSPATLPIQPTSAIPTPPKAAPSPADPVQV